MDKMVELGGSRRLPMGNNQPDLGDFPDIREGIQLMIVCEGRDEENFLNAFFHAVYGEDALNKVQIYSVGGISKIPGAIGNMEQRIESAPDCFRYIAIVRDAETDVHAAMQSIQTAFENTERSAVPKKPGIRVEETEDTLWTGIRVGYLLLPTCDENPAAGTLEDLALSTVKGESVSACLGHVDTFLQRSKKNKD